MRVNLRTAMLVVTTLAGAGLLAGLGVLSFGSPEQISRIPVAGFLGAAVTTLFGMIYLQASRTPAPAGQKSQSTILTIGFAILVVIAFVLVGFFLTHH